MYFSIWTTASLGHTGDAVECHFVVIDFNCDNNRENWIMQVRPTSWLCTIHQCVKILNHPYERAYKPKAHNNISLVS